MNNQIAIVVPAYNEAKRIGKVLRDLTKTKFPIFVVDDGSSDKTLEIAKKYKVTVLRHLINLGKGAALKTGCEAAFLKGATGIVVMDSDGQHKVEDLPKFVEALSSGNFEIVFGSRNLGVGVPLIRYIGNKLASLLISFMFGIYVSDLICGFRAFTKKAYEKLKLESVGYGVETEMVLRVGRLNLKHGEIPVQTIYFNKFKGVTILDALGIFFNVISWKIKL